MQLGKNEEVGSIKKKLEELEERAEELDRQRSKGLSAIRYKVNSSCIIIIVH